MGDNKISEAFHPNEWMQAQRMKDALATIRQAAIKMDETVGGSGDPVLDASDYLEAAIAHLQGEAVPVAWLVRVPGKPFWDKIVRREDVASEHAESIHANHGESPEIIPLYAHPQPAELSEVSGGSGESGERQSAWNDSARLACLESWAREPGGLLLHAESETGRRGLGLGENCGRRTLAQAIDSCATHSEKRNR